MGGAGRGIGIGGVFATVLVAAPPALLPGEGLALAGPEGPVTGYGEYRRVAPMGSLAKLLWLRLEGEAWRSRGVTFTCTGAWQGWSCWNREGHGAVDLAKALGDSCNLAFLAWILESEARNRASLGPDVTRARLEAVFAPFWSLVPEGPLPSLGPPWVGDGDLLRTSPEAFVGWLRAPEQARLRALLPRLLGETWVKTGTAPVPGRPDVTSAWVAGWDGRRFAVLHLPQGRGKAEGLARWRALMGPLP